MSDPGLQMLGILHEKLMIDDRWATRRERGFTWWGYRLAQHFEVDPPMGSQGLSYCNLRIWTEVVKDVDPAAQPLRSLGVVNLQATLSALVWDEQAATINECCAIGVHEDNVGWLGDLLATAAVLQNTAAHSRAHALARECGGVAAASNHPTSGLRPEMDDMLNVPEQVVVPEGAKPSRFEGPLSQGLAQFAATMGWYGNSDATGIVVEVPYTGIRPAFTQNPQAPDTALETALVRTFTDQTHPQFGQGALLVTQLPVAPGSDESVDLANRLNAAEAAGGATAAPLLGAWCPDVLSKDGNGLAFCSFLPNILARPMLLENQILYQGTRAQFARTFLG
ncbi:hypothetical protein C6A86_008815 [Mycobacterium sp. ITM-2016-00316]|uniref:hypothetical protein n=1 Tax=Mycobacterium sp. ITM-2016-00316 TaxID=2099695 RepID=UPI001157A916|nr:hypothetical protein [Mycobacterium sp. ITM-2016-00316]WNG83735.1 hypothetical protein C6A86_008815 [Mycobacterium sp. ITM-2016-00316]